MIRLPLLLFPVLVIVAAFSTLNSVAGLPESVAIHFNATGGADNWMTRDYYRVFILLFLVGLPLLLVWVMAGLPLITGGKGQIPNCEYWFADERQRATANFLLSHACWLGCFTAAVIYGIHISILNANAANPPMLAADRFLTMVLVYLCGLAWWITSYIRHFQNVAK